jgi:hypothetical protein
MGAKNPESLWPLPLLDKRTSNALEFDTPQERYDFAKRAIKYLEKQQSRN